VPGPSPKRFSCGRSSVWTGPRPSLPWRGFISGRTLSANQLEFVNLIIDHLTEHGVMQLGRLYESPFTDLTPRGPDYLFEPVELDALLGALEAVRSTAMAAA
jgi:type I restriction enzyme R subunit